MVKRTLTGSLSQLSPPVLLRLLAATAPSGVLELVSEAGALRLEVARGRIPTPGDDELRHAADVLRGHEGRFRFEPCELREPDGPSLGLLELVDAVQRSQRPDDDDRGAGEPADASAEAPDIHVLAASTGGNPLDELLSELEATAPGELLLAQVGVLAADPRLWRGALDNAWRRRGWNVVLLGDPAAVEVADFDLLVIHHQLSMTRVGREDDWLDVVRRGARHSPEVPVVWVGPLADGPWVYRLVDAGVRAVLPPPGADHGEAVARFTTALESVVERELWLRSEDPDGGLPGGIGGLVEAVLGDADTEQAVGALLQLAADRVSRGAVLLVEETAIRCRAGFGYPLARGRSVLPRGVGLLERVIRSGQPALGIDPAAAGAVELARALGVDRLPGDTAVIALGTVSGVTGLLVVDREGRPLADLDQLVLVAGRLGSVIVRPPAATHPS